MRTFQCGACSLEFPAPHASGPLPRCCKDCVPAQRERIRAARAAGGVYARATEALLDTNASRLTEFILAAKQAQGLIYMGRGQEAYDPLGDVLERRAPLVVYNRRALAV